MTTREDAYTFDLLGDEFFEEDATLTQILNLPTQQLFKQESQHATGTGSGRFEQPVSSDDIKQRNSNAVPKKTKQANDWALGVWRQWALHRNSQLETALEPGFPIPEDVGLLDDAMLDFWGQRFIMEIRRKDGKSYPPNTLVQIVSGIQRYLRNDCLKRHVNFFKGDDALFAGYRMALETKMKELQSTGIGCKTNSSEPVTRNDELQLWNTGVFSMDTAVGLSNAVFYYNGKVFGFRGFQEHVDCCADQISVGYDHENDYRFIRFMPRIRKNNQGGLKNRNISYDAITHYEQKDRDFSLVDMYSKYLLLIPAIGPLYRKPLNGTDENGNIKFSSAVIPQKVIKSMIKNFFEEAGINMDGRKITNHSARVTSCTTLYNDKFTDKAVTSRSKQRSSAVQCYQREKFSIMKDISNALEPPLSGPKRTTATVTTPTATETTSTCKTETIVDPLRSEFDAKNNELVISVPSCVQKVVLLKDGKKMVLEI